MTQWVLTLGASEADDVVLDLRIHNNNFTLTPNGDKWDVVTDDAGKAYLQALYDVYEEFEAPAGLTPEKDYYRIREL